MHVCIPLQLTLTMTPFYRFLKEGTAEEVHDITQGHYKKVREDDSQNSSLLVSAPRWPPPRLLCHTPNYPDLCCLAAFTPKGSLLHLCLCCCRSQKALPLIINIHRFLLFWGTVVGPSLTTPTPTHYRSSFMTPSALADSAVWERNGAVSFILGFPGFKLEPDTWFEIRSWSHPPRDRNSGLRTH